MTNTSFARCFFGPSACRAARRCPHRIAVLGSLFLGAALVGCGSAAPPPPAEAPYYAQSAQVTPMSPGSGGSAAGGAPVPAAERVQMESSGSIEADAPAGFASTPAPAPRPPPPAPASSGDKSKKSVDSDGAKDERPPPPGQTRAPGTAGGESAPSNEVAEAPHDAAMLIYTAHITMAVYQVEPGLAAVEKIARDLGGYLATRSDTEITVRIPRGRFDEAVRRVGLTGDVVHRDISAEDVTDEVVDLEARLRNARNMRDRLAQLLKSADVKASLEIEKELGRITGEIEQMEGKLKVLKDKISYSSITVSFQARGPGALRDVPLRLPFPWLSELGLPRLLSLHE